MAECKYSLIRYVADPLKDERTNIGVIVHAPGERFLGFDLDLRRVRSKVTRSDKEALKHYELQLTAIENEDMDWDAASFEGFRVADPEFLDKLSDYLGSKVVIDSPRGCISPSPDRAVADLFQKFVGVTRVRPARTTKRVLIHNVKEALAQRGVGEYLKSRPTIQGTHRAYTLPLGIRHAHKTYVEALNVLEANEASYRAMASIARLWTDARHGDLNRGAELYALIHYGNGARLPEGERLLLDDGVRVIRQPAALLEGIDFARVHAWGN